MIGLKGLSDLIGWSNQSRLAKPAITIGLVMLSSMAFACDAGPNQNQDEVNKITVPDEVSRLPSDEVERRLGGLLADGGAGGPSLSAPDSGPTATPEDPLDQILEALESSRLSELLITVSPTLYHDLSDPELIIKSPPTKGQAIAISTNKILFVPDEGATGADSFEYELLDGEISVFSAVVELRPVSNISLEDDLGSGAFG